MAAKGEVDLVIRAKNEATKQLDAITKALDSLSDQQKIVGDSASKTDDQLGKLGQELANLRTNAQNLAAMATIGDVLNKATEAMMRQREAAHNAATELEDAATRHKYLSARAEQTAKSLAAANKELAEQQAALKGAKSDLSGLNKEATALNTQERSLIRSLDSTNKQLATRRQALQEAQAKHADLNTQIQTSTKVTKRLQNSFEAAERAVQRRAKAVEESVAKEAELSSRLSQTRTALRDNAAAQTAANAALETQVAKTKEASSAVASKKVLANSLSKSEKAVATEVTKATAAVTAQNTALDSATKEFADLQAVADKARAKVGETAKTTADAGNAASKAGVQVAVMAAKLALLSRGRQGTTAVKLVDPAEVAQAEARLRTLGVTIRAAGNEAAASSVSATELTAALKGVSSSRSQLESIASALKTQDAAVTGARDSWKAAEAEVRRLALAVKATAQPSEELAAAFGRAQGQARLAKDEFKRQETNAKQLGEGLRAVGVGAGDLASAEAALSSRIKNASQMMNQGSAAAAKMSSDTGKLGNQSGAARPKMQGLATSILAVVSAANRLGQATNPVRAFSNQLTGMIAASVGLYAIKEQLTSIWQAGSDLAANEAKFATAFGSMEAGSKELAYARQVAIDLKLPLDALTKGYADLALAAKGTSMEGESARKVFVAFAQTARAHRRPGDSLKGVYVALTQIMSKGKVQAEELRQQLGDRLPGAMQLMAEGLGVTTGELDKMMERGQLTREALLSMAAVASGRVAPLLTEALSTPAAKLPDFPNRILIFKETIAQSGFLDAVADGFDRIAQALSTPEALEGAKKLGEGLADLIEWLIAATDHIDTIIEVLKGLGIAWAALQIGSIIGLIGSFAKGVGVATVAVTGLKTAMTPLLLGLSILGAAVAAVIALFAAWQLAKWAYNNFPAFAEGVLKVRKAAIDAFEGIARQWELTGSWLRNAFLRITAFIASSWYGMLHTILSAFPDLTEMLGLGEYASEVAAKAKVAAAAASNAEAKAAADGDAIRAKYAERERKREEQLQKDIAQYHADRLKKAEALEKKNEVKPGRVPKPVTSGALDTITAVPYQIDNSAANEKAAKAAERKRLALEQNVANQMYDIRSQLEKKSAQTLDEQLAAVPAKYAKLYDQLRQLGKDRNSEEWKTVDALVAQEQANIRSAHAKKEAAAAAKAEREATQSENKSRAEAMQHINTLMKTRKNIQEELKRAQEAGDVDTAARLQDNLTKITEQATNAIASMKLFWQSVGGAEADAAIAKLSTMELELTKVKSTAILTGENLAKAFGDRVYGAADMLVDKIAETGDVLGSVKEALRQFAIDFLKNIAKMILQQLVFNALSGLAGGGFGGGFFGTAANAGVFHSGGTVSGAATRSRSVPVGLFSNAVKYHGGGIVGLKNNEVPAILEAGEVVRTQQQEKALVDRQAMATAGGGSGAPSIKIVNQLDSGEVISAGLESTAGEKAFMNAIVKNRDQVKRLLG